MFNTLYTENYDNTAGRPSVMLQEWESLSSRRAIEIELKERADFEA